MQLEGKAVLITGAGSGIGRALAIACAVQGARLIMVGRRVHALQETALALGRSDALLLAADIGSAADRERIHCAIADGIGRLDVLINNAGVSRAAGLALMSETDVTEMVGTNLLAAMLLTRRLLPLLGDAAPGSRIVNIGSVFGDIAYPLFAVYSATKFGLRGFSDAMRRELKPLGIGVTYVAPRATRTAATGEYEELIEPLGMNVDEVDVVAGQVMRALARDTQRSYARGMERLFILLQRLAPTLVDRGIGSRLQRLDRPAGAFASDGRAGCGRRR